MVWIFLHVLKVIESYAILPDRQFFGNFLVSNTLLLPAPIFCFYRPAPARANLLLLPPSSTTNPMLPSPCSRTAIIPVRTATGGARFAYCLMVTDKFVPKMRCLKISASLAKR